MNIYIFVYVEAWMFQPSDEWKKNKSMYLELVRSLLFFYEFSSLIEVAFLSWKICWEAANVGMGYYYPSLFPSKGFVPF